MTISFVPLLSIAFHVVYIMCFFVAGLNARGWPHWFRHAVPWFPGPDNVMGSLPVFAFLLLGLAWYLSKARSRGPGSAPKDFIILRNVATGIAAFIILGYVGMFLVWA